MKLDSTTAQAVSASLQRMHQRSAFFSSLALFAQFEASEQLPTAATDGRTIYVNPTFFGGLTPDERDGLLAHEILHAALLHVPRKGGRDPQLWNIAADIVINGMLIKDGYSLPQGGLRNQQIEHLSAEEVYELLLQKQQASPQPSANDLLDGPPGDAAAQSVDATPGDQQAHNQALERHWQHAQQQARLRAEADQPGTGPGGFARELGALAPGRLDWRSVLWRFLVKTPSEFQEYDRRFVGQGMYLETISGDSLTVLLAVDTSGSIDKGTVQIFLGEAQAILRSYPHLRCELYYADTEVYGPHRLTASGALPAVVGGGGTDFRPFFSRIPRHRPPWEPSVAIYMTDGFGSFPEQAPRIPVLWVVTPGGLDRERFPFGQAVQLLPHR
jgi:predicted metal-dependent peptidase